MASARKDDESVQTSLRALMEQEADRLEQLRAAKARIDRERAEAAVEEEERRRTEREAKIAVAVERARIEALLAPAPTFAPPAAPPPPAILVTEKPSRFVPGVATGAIFGLIAAAACWYAIGAPRIAQRTKQTVDAWAELERVRTRAGDAQRTSDDALEALRKDTRQLRAENQRLRDDLAAPKPTCAVTTTAPHHTQRPHCDPHDPLCGDL